MKGKYCIDMNLCEIIIDDDFNDYYDDTTEYRCDNTAVLGTKKVMIILNCLILWYFIM